MFLQTSSVAVASTFKSVGSDLVLYTRDEEKEFIYFNGSQDLSPLLEKKKMRL